MAEGHPVNKAQETPDRLPGVTEKPTPYACIADGNMSLWTRLEASSLQCEEEKPLSNLSCHFTHLGDIIEVMEQVLTIVCKLNPTPQQALKLDKTLQGFADACNYINSTVSPKVTNKNRIQAETYKDVRAQFGLTANLAVRACARVAANRKVAKPVKLFQPTSADYDARIFDYREKEQCLSLSTIEGRERIPLILGNYQIGKLKGQKPTSATLCKHRDGTFNIHIQVKDDVQEPTPA